VLVPPDVVTVTFTAPPLLAAGVVTEMLVSEIAVTLPCVFPKSTMAPLAKFVPKMVTAVPPPIGPNVGLMLVTTGTPEALVPVAGQVSVSTHTGTKNPLQPVIPGRTASRRRKRERRITTDLRIMNRPANGVCISAHAA
jgi:hypothetical protein